MPYTLPSLLSLASAKLRAANISNAPQEARWLLEFVIGKALPLFSDRLIPPHISRRYLALVNRRARRFPLQYILGFVDFAGVRIQLTPAALIPRPETEELAHLAIAWLKIHPLAHRVADLGTGSGCLAIAIAHACPHVECWACDISSPALALARRNARLNAVTPRIHFTRASWFDNWPQHFTFDLIVTNPPYVEEDATLQPELSHEPSSALFAGPDGLDAYRQILPQVPRRLSPGGLFLGEIGANQRRSILQLARSAGLRSPRILRDSRGLARFLYWQKH